MRAVPEDELEKAVKQLEGAKSYYEKEAQRLGSSKVAGIAIGIDLSIDYLTSVARHAADIKEDEQ